MRLLRIDHVSLNAADRDATIAWYEDVLGLRPTAPPRAPDHPVFVGPDGAQLGLFADRAPGLRHVALATDDAGYEEVLARLRERGIEHRLERHGSGRSVYLSDPDGVTLEVMTAQ